MKGRREKTVKRERKCEKRVIKVEITEGIICKKLKQVILPNI
jgi:hypothetical protein